MKRWRIPRECLHPLLVSSRYSRYYVFTRSDWGRIRREKWVFTCRRPRRALPEDALKYIEWGEGGCRTRDGKICSQASACIARRRSRGYVDWYDLGGVLDTPVFTPYYAQYLHRFTLVEPGFKVALDADFITFMPRQGVLLDTVELKALLAYLNSSFIQLYIESRGRTTGGGMSALEVEQAREMPILDVRRLPPSDVRRLAQLFDKLDAEARRLGGADRVENLLGPGLARELTGREASAGVAGLFDTVIRDIDYSVAEILGLEALVDNVRTLLINLLKRRLSRAREARPAAIRGSEPPTELKKPRRRRQREIGSYTLDKWLNSRNS